MPGPSFDAKASFVPSSTARTASPKFEAGSASQPRTVSVTFTTRKLRAWYSAPATEAIGAASTAGAGPLSVSDHVSVIAWRVRSPALPTLLT